MPRSTKLIRTCFFVVLAFAHAPANTPQAAGFRLQASGSSTAEHRVAPESTSQHPQAPDSTPLPDVSVFAAKVRARLRSDRALQAQYTFLERREEISMSKLGKVKDGPVKTYEVYPSEDPGNLYKRLVSVDGKALSAAELAKNDAVHQKHIFARLNESPAQKAKRAREEAKERAEEQREIDEIFAVYDIRLVRREVVGGHPTILAALEPRRTYKARTDEGKVMKKIRARAWIHEAEYQIVRVEIEALEDIGFGLGVVGKIYKGTVGEFVRTKVNGEVWLPARARFTAKGRALFRKFSIDSVIEWWDYKKFSVSTTEETR
jgi:hypothetical protein